ncbi:MAG TPA: TusE/DsrC/DsvC family sulfur relay protein [Gaiellaceae bacterium]|nr:TusE/DsrC/DsvC family sulfur relay protein [Gaiellaceae bacterium]
MTTTLYETDAEGFLANPQDWTEEIAEEIAVANGVPELTDRHWQVVRFMRERYLATGTAPTIRSLGKESGVPVKELYQLFPKGPAKLAAKIGGIPKPQGCI